MTKLRPSCTNDEEEDPVIIQINQGRSCVCRTEGKPTKSNKDVAPFPFKEGGKSTMPLLLDERSPVVVSDSSESILSVVPISTLPPRTPNELPLVTPREHGPLCALEVSVLEKHAEGCSNRKREKEGRHPIDDKVGSYDVVNRTVYRTCAGKGSIDDHGDAIKNSLKSFKLNDPRFFGKDLKEQRSRIETLPILPNYDNCLMRVQSPRIKNPFQQDETYQSTKPIPQCTTVIVDDEPIRPKVVKCVNDNLEVLSVYIRKDKGDKVPAGFQKLHYRGDSCKLHNPNERSKQILALQKVIDETASGAELARSERRFSPLLDRDAAVMAAVGSPLQLPTSVYPPVGKEESEESLEMAKNIKRAGLLDRNEDSDEISPTRSLSPHRDDDGNSQTGFFRCFKKGKPKRQQQDSYAEDRTSSNRKVTHSDSQPKRHSDSMPRGQRKLSAEYSNRRNL